jgi:hypothetical protein
MDPVKQRIAIAKACGWTCHWDGGDPCSPDYTGDLNAMHEAEETLTFNYWNRYAQWLRELTRSNRRFLIAHATAAQRAEAFLRTIGKWEEL